MTRQCILSKRPPRRLIEKQRTREKRRKGKRKKRQSEDRKVFGRAEITETEKSGAEPRKNTGPRGGGGDCYAHLRNNHSGSIMRWWRAIE
ncbi:hypothetical protein EUGRSUZ_F00040 [Eucalyptus grandis]|uniref:Uncharacterized protein n=2 Tax=Eucalyptus grandis TaxID=71139 RepID=A0ACC3K9S3_EUCGR|nr:hypothetical protein EUGRSUZ_F00040 [Eucalyptus grandis]